jgi:hypothetical protein
MQNARIALVYQATPQIDENRVTLTTETAEDRVSLSVRSDGGVIFTALPSAAEQPLPTPTAAPGPSSRQESEVPVPGPLTTGADRVQEEMPTPAGQLFRGAVPAADRREATQERVSVTGHVGETPKFHRTRKNYTLVGRFPLGILEEGREEPTWRRVLIFGERAERLQEHVRSDVIRKGTEVAVVGYVHEHEVRGRKGPRTVKEIYAVVVNPVTPR